MFSFFKISVIRRASDVLGDAFGTMETNFGRPRLTWDSVTEALQEIQSVPFDAPREPGAAKTEPFELGAAAG